MDLVVENSVVVEVKAVAKLDRVHEAQFISYLKLSGLRLGLLLNFNVRNLSGQGIVRRVNDFPE
jgi:GxxExxY protein